ncbi:MAG: hypothetical protein AAGI07_08085 [Bacteroidota bacterium]
MEKRKPLSSKERNEIHKWFNKIDEFVAKKKEEKGKLSRSKK